MVRGDGEHLFRRLFRRQLFADHAGTRFIGAIIFAIAVIALDVAGGRHGDMHARIMMMRLFAVAGMVLHLLPDFGRHVLRPVAGAAARLARRRPKVPQPLCSATCCITASRSTPAPISPASRCADDIHVRALAFMIWSRNSNAYATTDQQLFIRCFSMTFEPSRLPCRLAHRNSGSFSTCCKTDKRFRTPLNGKGSRKRLPSTCSCAPLEGAFQPPSGFHRRAPAARRSARSSPSRRNGARSASASPDRPGRNAASPNAW